MALQMNITKSMTNYGKDFNNAYLMITDIVSYASDEKTKITLRGYIDSSARTVLKTYLTKEKELSEKMKDPESDDSEIEKLTNEVGQKPIGIYRDIIEVESEKIVPYLNIILQKLVKNGTEITDKIYQDSKKEACYNYIKENIDTYKSAKNV